MRKRHLSLLSLSTGESVHHVANEPLKRVVLHELFVDPRVVFQEVLVNNWHVFEPQAMLTSTTPEDTQNSTTEDDLGSMARKHSGLGEREAPSKAHSRNQKSWLFPDSYQSEQHLDWLAETD